MTRVARSWAVFALGNAVVALALGWMTWVVLDLEARERRARRETDYEQSLRLAIGRMDSWLAALLAQEAARPTSGYLAAAAADYLNLRFEIDDDGTVRAAHGDLARFRNHLDRDAVLAAIPHDEPEPDTRVACLVPRPPGDEAAGRQVVAWLDASPPEEEAALAFLRRAESKVQGFLLDWPRLHDRLLLEIRDLFPEARLERADGAGDAGPGLASIPVKLFASMRPATAASGLTAGRTALGVAWLAAIVAAVAVGVTLRKSIELGERRRRFASAVTHELRTPLTTFRMYSEMLADGLVTSDEQRAEYLSTLRDEARRLSTMVSNVLMHARLEKRGTSRQYESMTLEQLLARLRPPLERRVEATPMVLEVTHDGSASASIRVDPEAVGQILGNLVDNAAKYALGDREPTIRLVAAAENGSLVMTVRDHGPGIPGNRARAVFAPFERGGRDPADPVPGVGLGLALARGLARDMGGDLTLDSPPGGGASFRLVLPLHRG